MLREVDAVARDDRVGAFADDPDQFRGRRDRPDRVRREGERDDLRPLVERGLERRPVERHVVTPDIHPSNGSAGVSRGKQPRPDIRVVIEPRDDDLVAGPECSCDRSRDREQERRRVRAEDHLVGIGVQQVGRGAVRLVDQRVGLAAGLERAVDVRVASAEIVGHRLDNDVGHLRPAGSVEERDGPTADLARQ